MTDKLARAIDDLRRKWVPDRRLGVFEVRLVPGDVGAPHAAPLLAGVTTSRDALTALRRLAAEAGLAAEITLLPDGEARVTPAAIVTAAVAPLLDEPRISAPRVSELLHGETVAALERRECWLRVRAGDGYHGWTHAGYVATGSQEWADDWAGRATARSLGADLRRDAGRLRLPIGARLALGRGRRVETADGGHATVAAGAVRPEAEVRAEARMVAAPELGLGWYAGAPYLWGGRTEWGIDCSGFAQSLYAARGVALPRDTDLQFGAGREVPIALNGAGYEAGDLLFFADGGRVSHVALWAGGARGRIVHAALSRGGVVSDDLLGDRPEMRRLAANLVGVRRLK